MKKLILLTIIFMGLLQAVTVTTNKATYTPNERATVNFTEMKAQNKDWIAIYPVGSSNAWENVVQWSWTHDVEQGSHTFAKLPVGNYEARVFFDNSFNTEALKAFQVAVNNPNDDAVNLKMGSFHDEDAVKNDIVIHYKKDIQGDCQAENRPENSQDWIGIYKKGTSTAWENVIKWAWVKDLEGYAPCDVNHVYQGAKEALAQGGYEGRFFKNNSYIINKSLEFNVGNVENDDAVDLTIAGLDNDEGPRKDIIIHYKKDIEGDCKPENRPENAQDWIGIYKKGTSTAWENVIKWAWVKDLHGYAPCDVNHVYVKGRDGLKHGEYEARFFKNNSYIIDKSLAFVEN